MVAGTGYSGPVGTPNPGPQPASHDITPNNGPSQPSNDITPNPGPSEPGNDITPNPGLGEPSHNIDPFPEQQGNQPYTEKENREKGNDSISTGRGEPWQPPEVKQPPVVDDTGINAALTTLMALELLYKKFKEWKKNKGCKE